MLCVLIFFCLFELHCRPRWPTRKSRAVDRDQLKRKRLQTDYARRVGRGETSV